MSLTQNHGGGPELAPGTAEVLQAATRMLLRARWIVRVPVWLYRARLGFMFGSRLLMLEHTGRATGARRFAVLEVVARPQPGTFVVASGFGARAQWFRNVRANPDVRVYLGARRPAAATARLLASEEAGAALAAYASSHPRQRATLKPVFEATLGARISLDALAARLSLPRNAVYKVIFDARRKIRRALAANGYLEQPGMEQR